MFRIDSAATVAAPPTPAAVGPLAGYFSEGDPVNSVPATVVSADWLNMVQEEIVSVVTGAALTLSKVNRGQLLAAVQKLIRQGGQVASASLALTNNQASAMDVTGFPTVDSSTVRAFEAFITIMRRTDTQYAKQTGRLYGTYDTETSSWDIGFVGVHDDAGVAFQMTLVSGTTWKLQYTTDNLSGASYAGTLKMTDILFNLV